MPPHAPGNPVDRAREAARSYRGLNWNPLPSRTDAKSPALDSYARYWDEPVGEGLIEGWATPNLQLVCGVRWGLCVVDCDGLEAMAEWSRLLGRFRSAGEPWLAYSGRGEHYYFSVPPGVSRLPSRLLWGVWDAEKGDWVKGKKIELLADHKLVIAPPSRHVETGREYEWARRRGPRRGKRPPELPRWVRLMRPAGPPPRPPATPTTPTTPTTPFVPSGRHYSRAEVLAAISDKKAVALGWGLRFARDTTNDAGWYPVHAVTRGRDGDQDQNASASFNDATGVYMEMYDREPWSLFDLGARLRPNLFKDWQECVNYLGDLYLGGKNLG